MQGIKKIDVWLIADRFVCEPSVSGMQIGEIGWLDMSLYNIVARFTEEECIQQHLEYFEEHGSWPDT
jgi:hypothetical protein